MSDTGDPRHQRLPWMRERETYRGFSWPRSVHVAARGYRGDGGVAGVIARGLVELVAQADVLPGFSRWSARHVVYVGRAGDELIAVRKGSEPNAWDRNVTELWRARLGALKRVRGRVGWLALFDAEGHRVWLWESDAEALMRPQATPGSRH